MNTQRYSRLKVICHVAFILCLFVPIASCRAAKDERREAMRQMQGIIYGLHYKLGLRGFPDSGIATENKSATCSWRRILVSNPLYRSRCSESWKSVYVQIEDGKFVDNENNRRKFIVKGRADPSMYTQIFALIGPGTAFTEFSGIENTDTAEPDAILLLDCQNKLIHWMEPGDIDIDHLLSLARDESIGQHLTPNYPEGFLVGFIDGAVWWIRKDVPQEVILPFLTLEGAGKHDRDDELTKYAFDKLPPFEKHDGRYSLPADWKVEAE
jgi:hypothetical protein